MTEDNGNFFSGLVYIAYMFIAGFIVNLGDWVQDGEGFVVGLGIFILISALSFIRIVAITLSPVVFLGYGWFAYNLVEDMSALAQVVGVLIGLLLGYLAVAGYFIDTFDE